MIDPNAMHTASTMCMDILVNKPEFPDFAFVLYQNGWFTHHVVLERPTAQIRGRMARGCRRENRAPSQVGKFDREYADLVFKYMEDRNRNEGGGFNVDEVAVVPFDDREKEVLSLGKIVETHTFPDGVTVKTLNYQYREGKRIKIYSPPNASLVERLG